MKYQSLSAKARWKKTNKKDRLLHIQKMNKARIKKMQENKRDAEAYRRLVLLKYDLKDLDKSTKNTLSTPPIKITA